MKIPRLIILLMMVATLLVSCGKSEVDQALDSDANGFICPNCKAKFYTERNVFATRCPDCQKPRVEMVLGFVCSDDKHITYAARGHGSAACEQCGKVTSNLKIPNEAELKAWGAIKKTKSEVGG
ncbi:MAG: hypothetical protein WDM76_15450 [Limisphaerales bacterium]